MIRPGTDWDDKAPEILCKSSAAGISALIGAGIGLGISPNIVGGIAGSVIGSAISPAFEYALCGDYGSTSPPLDGENELPESNVVFNIGLTRTIKVEVLKPPKQLDVEIVRRTYNKDDEEEIKPGSTRFPLYKAISARESLKKRKFGCILYQPVSDEPMKLSRCNIQRTNNDIELQDKQRLADFIIKQESKTLGMGVAIMSSMIQGRIATGTVIGPYILSATATAYAAFNKQMYSSPITKVPKRVEYESCAIAAPSIDIPFSIKKDTQAKFEPFIEITSPLGGASN